MQWSVFRSVVEWPGVGCVTCFVHTGTLVCLCVFMVSAHPAKRRQGHWGKNVTIIYTLVLCNIPIVFLFFTVIKLGCDTVDTNAQDHTASLNAEKVALARWGNLSNTNYTTLWGITHKILLKSIAALFASGLHVRVHNRSTSVFVFYAVYCTSL